LIEIKDLLIAPGLCHFHGILEYWNIGIRAEINHFNCKKILSFNFLQEKLTHHSITPSFHYSNWGEALKFYPIFSKLAQENVNVNVNINV
jgi:hypothetical protein